MSTVAYKINDEPIRVNYYQSTKNIQAKLLGINFCIEYCQNT
jgi:hypothetical protein